jgi:pimeloyl-ACP methyl ester carboxylesterase
MTLQAVIETMINAIVRPPRRDYSLDSLPSTFSSSEGHQFACHSVTFVNDRNQKLIGSIYVDTRYRLTSGLPCVIYLHGNASSQLEGQFLVPNLCPYGFAVYLFDFAGCGHSDGDYVSLGLWETSDINFLIHQLSNSFNFTRFVLWGRSMGAATALLCRNANVRGIIVDSAYTSIKGIVKSLAKRIGIPKWIVSLAMWFLVYTVWDVAGFDVREVRPKDACVLEGNPPMMMAHSPQDEFVSFEMGEKLFRKYSSRDKTLIEVEGGHNAPRPAHWFRECYRFVFQKAGVDFGAFRLVSVCGFESAGAHFASLASMLVNSREERTAVDGACMMVRVVSDEGNSEDTYTA